MLVKKAIKFGAQALGVELTEPEEKGMNNGINNDVNDEVLGWLLNVPVSDVNFQNNIKIANEATIRAALSGIEGFDHVKTKEAALNRRLKQVLEAQAEQVTATETRQTRTTAMNVGELEAESEREQQLQAQEEQKDRERRIAEAHEVAGRIQALTFVEKVLTVSTLIQLKNIKESKAYRNLPNIGTWDNYCEYLGFSRQKVDMDLQNLAEFGEQFLLTVGSFGLGYRELRQLRQIKYDGESFQVSEDGKTIVIEGEAISLNDDAAPEIEAALEKLLEKNKTLRERNTRLEKDLKGVVKEEMAGLQAEKKALVERVKVLEVFEPKEADREWSVKQMAKIEEAAAGLQLAIAGFIADPRLKDDRHLQAKVNAHLQEAELALNDVRTRLDDVVDMYRD
ncbi:hypothetical protein [Geobacter sp. SVR]|uniref:hypothetical protein n=1 Tax=Geobacter sp. SVR TaxID=2495594 RepID=UPI00143EF613|nr:hypothetical protein [Geobacter sp. SVR]BCS55160.1 hypothetical protein GSVR_34680 [Geobacter sp. SVR]GCF85341.1 hypothetical protein GSbR_19410 [Geobacter sp. SVR]